MHVSDYNKPFSLAFDSAVASAERGSLAAGASEVCGSEQREGEESLTLFLQHFDSSSSVVSDGAMRSGFTRLTELF